MTTAPISPVRKMLTSVTAVAAPRVEAGALSVPNPVDSRLGSGRRGARRRTAAVRTCDGDGAREGCSEAGRDRDAGRAVSSLIGGSTWKG